jgi:hypothetical protein
MILDIEATSLHPTRSYPLEIAWSLPGGKVRSFLVNLRTVLDRMDWCEFSHEKHGIELDHAMAEGEDPALIVNQFLEDLGDSLPYSDAPEMDHRWLAQLFKMANQPLPFNQILPVNDLYIAELRKNGFSYQEASSVAEQIIEVDIEIHRMHRAAEDVSALQYGLKMSKAMAPQNKIQAKDYQKRGFELDNAAGMG